MNRITARLTPLERQSIDLLVKRGSYKDITDLVRQGIATILRVEGLGSL